LLGRSFLVSCSFICQSFLSVAETFEFHLRSHSLLFPALSFKVSSLILRSLIYFELILVEGKKHESSFRLLHENI
jgi:hypothetical protein